MTYWRDCWSVLQPILSTRAPHPKGGEAAGGEGACDQPESQHEAMLVRCGLNAVAARCVLQSCDLAAFLGIPPRLRSDYFNFISDRAASVLSAVVDDDDVSLERGPADVEPQPPHHQQDEYTAFTSQPVQPPPSQDESSRRQHELDVLRSRHLGYTSNGSGQSRLEWFHPRESVQEPQHAAYGHGSKRRRR